MYSIFIDSYNETRNGATSESGLVSIHVHVFFMSILRGCKVVDMEIKIRMAVCFVDYICMYMYVKYMYTHVYK